MAGRTHIGQTRSFLLWPGGSRYQTVSPLICSEPRRRSLGICTYNEGRLDEAFLLASLDTLDEATTLVFQGAVRKPREIAVKSFLKKDILFRSSPLTLMFLLGHVASRGTLVDTIEIGTLRRKQPPGVPASGT